MMLGVLNLNPKTFVSHKEDHVVVKLSLFEFPFPHAQISKVSPVKCLKEAFVDLSRGNKTVLRN